MNTRRPKIFCQFVGQPRLTPISGDRINEIRFYRALATFADVYYNDERIDWENLEIGRSSEIKEPSRDYDLYYVRANNEFFKRLPHPKVTLAYPYEAEVFEMADAVLVTTQRWQELLQEHNSSPTAQRKLAKWYPSQIVEPRRLLNIKQTIDPYFCKECPSQPIFEWKARMTNATIFGFFGRITDDTIPFELVEAVAEVRRGLGDSTSPLVAFAGSIRTSLPSPSVNLGNVAYQRMPALLRACGGTLGQSCPDSDFLGSGKFLDSMACGVPIICRPNAVRIEQVGERYPGFYRTQAEARELVRRLCVDDAFGQELRQYLSTSATPFLPSVNGRRIRAEIESAGLL